MLELSPEEKTSTSMAMLAAMVETEVLKVSTLAEVGEAPRMEAQAQLLLVDKVDSLEPNPVAEELAVEVAAVAGSEHAAHTTAQARYQSYPMRYQASLMHRTALMSCMM